MRNRLPISLLLADPAQSLPYGGPRIAQGGVRRSGRNPGIAASVSSRVPEGRGETRQQGSTVFVRLLSLRPLRKFHEEPSTTDLFSMLTLIEIAHTYAISPRFDNFVRIYQYNPQKTYG